MSVVNADGCPWPLIHIPESCKGVDIVIGIDEAGRGPVLGSLIYAAAFWPVSEDAEIKKMAFDDSKQLKEGERDRLLDSIRSHPSIGWVVEELSAEKISKEMLRAHPISLNAISYDAVITILSRIRDEKPEPPMITDIYIDTVGDPEFYKSKLQHALGTDFGRFTIEKKADATYKVVSAASIVAKVTRDTLLKNWVWKEPTVKLDKNFGSGYPGDENCVKWLATAQHPVFGFPNLIRFSWSTTKEALIKSKACKVTWECDEEDTGGADMRNFFSAPGINKKVIKRAPYFVQRKMKHLCIEDLLN